MSSKNFIIKNGLTVGSTEVINSSGIIQGAAVNEAIDDGELGYYRLEAYNKALKINEYTERREIQKQRIIESRNLKRKWTV